MVAPGAMHSRKWIKALQRGAIVKLETPLARLSIVAHVMEQ